MSDKKDCGCKKTRLVVFAPIETQAPPPRVEFEEDPDIAAAHIDTSGDADD